MHKPFAGVEVPGPKRDFVGYGRRAPRVNWPGGARVAVSIVINYEEGSEYAHPNGDGRNDGLVEMTYAMDPSYRDLCAESVFEYGSRAGIWRIERLLTELKLPATIYACAVALERNREVAAWIREAGHEACSHGWRWEEVWRLSREEEAEHIRLAIESIRETTGERPLGWYCRYGPSVRTRELLVEEGGFVYDFGRLQRRPSLLRRCRRGEAARRSLFDDLQRRQIQPAAERRIAGRLSRQSQAGI